MIIMTNLLCEKCGDYGLDMVDGVCSVCLDGHKQAQPEPAKPTRYYEESVFSSTRGFYKTWVKGDYNGTTSLL